AWRLSGTHVRYPRNTSFRSSVEMSDALTLGFATTLKSAALAGDAAARPSVAIVTHSARLMMSRSLSVSGRRARRLADAAQSREGRAARPRLVPDRLQQLVEGRE